MKYPRNRFRAPLHLDALEPRALLSVTPFVNPHGGPKGGGGGSGGGGQQAGTGVTPLSDFTGNPLTINTVVGLPAVQASDFEGLQRLVHAGQTNLPAVQHLDDIATLTSSSFPVKLRGYSVSIDWGDGSAPTSGWLLVDKSTGTVHVKGLHSYSAVGSFAITITVSQTTSVGGSPTTTSLIIDSTANVTQDSAGGVDVAPNTGVPFTGIVGNFTAPGTDPGAFTALINWGDDSPPSAATIALNLDGTFSVTGTHTYAADGTYRIAIQIYQNAPAGVIHANPNNKGLHLGWRHSFQSAIYSTATVSAVVPPPPGP